MKKQRIIIRDHQAIENITAILTATLELDCNYVCDIKKYVKSRTLPQNAISHAWYSEVAKKEKEYHETEVKCLCKLHIGLNIIRGVDEEYNDLCARHIDILPYEHKLEAMLFFPVTSLFSSEQFTRYLEGVRKNYSGRVDLRFPDEQPLEDL